MTKTFLRRDWKRYSKLGKNRKKKQVWRRPKGRDNKMRERRKGYPAVVSLGYRTQKDLRDNINGKVSILINNIKDLKKVGKNNIIIVGSVGKKKKIEIAKKINEMKLAVYNINPRKFLEKSIKLNKEKSKK